MPKMHFCSRRSKPFANLFHYTLFAEIFLSMALVSEVSKTRAFFFAIQQDFL
jgi:hypothetical protein